MQFTRYALPAAWMGALVAGLCLTRLYSYLLFHSVVELFTIAVALSVFFLAWNARRFLENHYLLLVGIASLFIAIIDSLHALSYRGMGVFEAAGANLPTQFWIAGRYLQSLTFLAAPLYLTRPLRTGATLAVYSAAVLAAVGAIFTGRFPDCFLEQSGLTPFKIYSEYAVILILGGAAFLIFRNRSAFDQSVHRWLSASILLTAASEAAFTLYEDVYGLANMAGHLLRFVAFCFVYRAIIVTGVIRPYDLVFRNLTRSEEALRRADERYRAFLAHSAEGICRVELQPPVPIDRPEDEQVRLIVERGLMAECNDRLARMHGLATAAEILGKPLPAVPLHPEQSLRQFVRSGCRTEETEYSETLGDGSVRYFAGSYTGVIEGGLLIRIWGVERDITERRRAALEREELIAGLQQALAEVKTLSGLLPICANCKKIRDDKGYWTQVESYLEQRADVLFSHGICPGCLKDLYPEYCEEVGHESPAPQA